MESLVLATTYTNVADQMHSRPNIVIHMGASTWTAKVRAEDREPVYDLIKYYEQAVDLLLAVVQKNR
jgi:hypothetical protein